MTTPPRTEGAADGLREAVAQAIFRQGGLAQLSHQMIMNGWGPRADAAIAAVRQWDAAHPPELSATLAACGWPAGVPFKLWDDGDPHGSVYLVHPDKGMTAFGACEGDMDEQRVRFIVAACNAHLERLAAHPPQPAPQPVPVVATGADKLRDAIELMMHFAKDGGENEILQRFRAIWTAGSIALHGQTTPPAPGAPAAQATVPGGGVERLAADIEKLRHYASSRGILGLDHFLAAELTRLGWVHGGGLSEDVCQTIQLALPLLVRADDRTVTMDRVAKAQRAVREASPVLAALPNATLSDGARETILGALAWYVPNMGDAPMDVTAEIEAKVAVAQREIEALP